jgi:hypothetical protein
VPFNTQVSIRLNGKHVRGSPFSKSFFYELIVSRASLILNDTIEHRRASMLSSRRSLTHLGTCQDKAGFSATYFWGLVKGKRDILVLVRNTAGNV